MRYEKVLYIFFHYCHSDNNGNVLCRDETLHKQIWRKGERQQCFGVAKSPKIFPPQKINCGGKRG